MGERQRTRWKWINTSVCIAAVLTLIAALVFYMAYVIHEKNVELEQKDDEIKTLSVLQSSVIYIPVDSTSIIEVECEKEHVPEGYDVFPADVLFDIMKDYNSFEQIIYGRTESLYEECETACEIYFGLRDRGLTAYETSAILGNVLYESGYGDLTFSRIKVDSMYKHKTDKQYDAYGICQWLRKYNSKIFGADLDQQLDYLAFEYYDRENLPLSSSSIQQAAIDFTTKYEKCNGYWYKSVQKPRYEAAMLAYEKFELIYVLTRNTGVLVDGSLTQQAGCESIYSE